MLTWFLKYGLIEINVFVKDVVPLADILFIWKSFIILLKWTSASSVVYFEIKISLFSNTSFATEWG